MMRKKELRRDRDSYDDAAEVWGIVVVFVVILILAAYIIKFQGLAVEYQALYEGCKSAPYNLSWGLTP